MLRSRCDLTDWGCLCALISSLGSRSRRRRRSKIIASLSSSIRSVSHLLQVLFTTLDKAQILVLNHGVSFGTHVVSDCYPVRTKIRHIPVEILQFGDRPVAGWTRSGASLCPRSIHHATW
jgi:hypothetical protein